jgi:hypothetical protein
MKETMLIITLCLFQISLIVNAESTANQFSNCNIEDYYSNLLVNDKTNPSDWIRDNLAALLETTHAQSTPFVSATTPGQGGMFGKP